MKYIPHKYQEAATKHIYDNLKAGLFLAMGLGKTVITLTAIKQMIYEQFAVNKVLIIAPLRVAEDTWSREVDKWDHLKGLKISKILGSAAQRRAAMYADADIYVINRENVCWLVNELDTSTGTAWDFDMVVIDELSSFKSAKAQRFRSLRKVISGSRRVIGLTGTPAPNGLIDLWPQIYLLDQGERLGKTITGYRERYFSPNQRNAQVVFNYKIKDGSEESIREKIGDICMSMKAEDWLQMPARIDNIQSVKLSDKEMEAYRKFEKDAYMEFLNAEVTALTAAALTQKLLQYANGAMYYDLQGQYVKVSDKKLEALEEIIELSNGKPVLIFYSFKHDLERIKARVKGAVKLESAKDIEKWNKGEIPVMLAHPASAGHGLNLQDGGNIIVWFGLTWSLELYQQANARLYRQGQKQAVIIHHLIADGTVDEAVLKSLQGKTDVQESLLQALKARVKV
jgi:SNF2 family DNA or RNA helicase